jgi:hypothetical protein
MKSATEWLASSDDDSIASGPARKPATPRPKNLGVRRKSQTPDRSPTTQSIVIPESESPKHAASSTAPSARFQEAAERRRKQEELRERMKATLGANTVQAVAESAAIAAAKRLQSGPFTSDESFTSGGLLPPVVPSMRNSFDLGTRGGRRGSIPEHLEEVDVMLADRGTQTIENVSCQTDPDPRVLQCHQCYVDYYGHVPEYAGCTHSSSPSLPGPSQHGGPLMYGTDPVFASLMYRYNSAGVPPQQYLAAQQQLRGAPAAAAGGLMNAITSTALLREQLSSVQGTIDMLISRYNLPPPPGMEHLAVV